MRISVDDDRCRGHGICAATAPELFELTDDGYAVARVDTVEGEDERRAQSAERQCPERAVMVTDV